MHRKYVHTEAPAPNNPTPLLPLKRERRVKDFSYPNEANWKEFRRPPQPKSQQSSRARNKIMGRKSNSSRASATGGRNRENRWDDTLREINKHMKLIERYQHFSDSLAAERSEDSSNRGAGVGRMQSSQPSDEAPGDISKYNRLVYRSRHAVRQLVKSVYESADSHTQWECLKDDDEEGLIDTEGVMCSVCGQDERENDDILLCDREGCYRAYHQKCLDPVLTQVPGEDEDEWFCWRCECLDDIFDSLETNFDVVLPKSNRHWMDIFPQASAKESDVYPLPMNVFAGAFQHASNSATDESDEGINALMRRFRNSAGEALLGAVDERISDFSNNVLAAPRMAQLSAKPQLLSPETFMKTICSSVESCHQAMTRKIRSGADDIDVTIPADYTARNWEDFQTSVNSFTAFNADLMCQLLTNRQQVSESGQGAGFVQVEKKEGQKEEGGGKEGGLDSQGEEKKVGQLAGDPYSQHIALRAHAEGFHAGFHYALEAVQVRLVS